MIALLIIMCVTAALVWRLPTKRCGLRCDPTGGVLTAAVVIGAGSSQAYSQVKQGAAQKHYYDYLADTARAQGDAELAAKTKEAEIAEDVGSQQVKAQAVQGAELAGQQRAALSANGMGASGTAQDIAIDTMRKTQTNELNLKYNADLKAWQLDTEGKYAKWSADQQANQYNYAGKAAYKAGKRAAVGTLLSTAATVGWMGAQGMFSSAGGSGANINLMGGGGYSGGMPSGVGVGEGLFV